LKRTLLLTAAGILVAAVAFRWWFPTERLPSPAIAMPETRLDYQLGQFEARVYSESGALEFLLSGPALAHDPDTRVMALTRPEFRFEGSSLPWWGQADQGRFDRGMDTLDLIGGVEMWQDLPEGRLTVRSERLQHQRPARTISADVPVRLSRPGTELNAGGLMIQLDSETVELLNDVHIETTIRNVE
jgi:lipopolysaccharide export system protein LptC